jgi:putative ABC transport system permease protein
MREAIRRMNKDAPVEFGTMDGLVADSAAQQRFQMRLLALLAGLALTLAAVGIYGVISYSASRRTHEIGIRMALGAERYDVMRMVMAQGAGIAAAGIGIGVAGAAALSRVLISDGRSNLHCRRAVTAGRGARRHVYPGAARNHR